MANLQIKHVPDDMHAELRRRAELAGKTLRDYVLDLIRVDQQLPSKEEWLADVRSAEPVELGRPVSELIAEDRAERDREMDRRRTGRADE